MPNVTLSTDMDAFLVTANDAAARTELGVPGLTDAVTLTNKRITKRVVAVTSAATPVFNTDNGDVFTIDSLTVAITSMTTSMTGTPTDEQAVVFRFKDNGTARTIAWGASFASAGATLPTTTVISKWLRVMMLWNATASVFQCVSVAQEV